jgi:hypothetical protein
MGTKNSSFIVCYFCFLLIGCRTYTVLDTLFYESEYLSQPINSETQNAMCLAIENQGYVFDYASRIEPFEVVGNHVVVTYDDNQQSSYFTHYGLTAKILTNINRDFDLGPNGITDAELARLLPEAQQTCDDILAVSTDYALENVEITIWMWDWINGATAIATTQVLSDCSTLEWSVVSIGSGGDSYAYQTPTSVCQ